MRKVVVLALFFLAITPLFGQYLPGYLSSNYAGISRVDLQPASIADNRFKLDVLIVGANLSFYNNYVGLKRNTIPFYVKEAGAENSVFSSSAFPGSYLFVRNNDRDKSIFGNFEFSLPSFMYTINDKHAIGFTWRVRSLFNVDGLSSELADLVYNELELEDLWNLRLTNKNLSIQSMTWAEYGIVYGRVLMDEDPHFVKVGGRVKLLQGIQAGYMFLDAFDYSFANSDTLSVFKTNVHYGHSDNFDPSAPSSGYRFESKPSIGLDLGIEYEYRPNAKKYQYDMDGEHDVWRKDKNKYKWKLGASVTDLGAIKYNKSKGSRDFLAEINGWNIEPIDPSNINDFDDTLASRFQALPNDERSFVMQLPTAISLQVDYHVWNDFYLNVTPFWAFQRTNNKNRVHYISTYSFTPRYDGKWFGAFVPMSYNAYGNSAVGLSFRVGPVILGTTNLLPYFAKVNIFGADAHIALKLPLFHKGKPRDRDGDGVSDRKDDCQEVPGTWTFRGCPDTDMDGIPDTRDDCPTDSGLVELNGCPDRDQDGITDKYDVCPDLFGELAHQGCPDTDGDSIIDPEDKCPELAGILFYQGCPDTDGDSIIDPEDLCPEYAGPLSNQGCPDRDNDGIFDYLDECPEKAGPSENNGCPWPDTDEDGILDRVDKCPNNPGPKENHGCPYSDTDGDGVLDKDDDCPNVVGPPENAGCPIIEEKEQEIINTAFSNLEFETGKDVIRTSSLNSLDELAGLLIRKTEWKLLLEGHTDNVGNDQSNLILSKKRAEAVKKHLVKKGVDGAVIRVEFYGETKPIGDNSTESGRQKNRRVEMKIQFE
jgi:outer membrane protein OmpA-like peptidoglycan-associated protein